MSAYATTTQLAAYLAVSESSLSDDAARLLLRASELIDSATHNRVDLTIDRHKNAAQTAACAQVEFWLTEGEDRDISGPVQGYTASKVQMQYGAGDNRIAPAYMAPRARRALLTAGLLYCGAGVK